MADRPQLHRLRLVFADPALERGFRADLFARTHRQVRVALWVVLVFFALLAVGNLPWVQQTLQTERFFGPAVAELLTWFLWGIDVPVLAAVVALSHTRWFERFEQIAIWLAFAAVVLGVPAGAMRLPAGFSPYFVLSVVSFSTFAVYTVLRLRFVYAATLGAFIFVLYLWVLANRPTGLALWQDALNVVALAAVNLFGMIASYQAELNLRTAYFQRTLIERQQAALAAERDRSEALLLNILPPPIATRLKSAAEAIADGHAEVTVLFADIVGFTPLAARLSPEELVDLLNRVFSRFDEATHELGLEKIKTIGDAYMVAGGLPEPRPDHAEQVAELALRMIAITAEEAAWVAERHGVEGLSMRIGLHTGPVVAGVIGTRKFSYDLWGDTVNTASRMESHGVAGAVHLSESTYARLKDRYELQARGTVEIKGKGPMPTWLLAAHGEPRG